MFKNLIFICSFLGLIVFIGCKDVDDGEIELKSTRIELEVNGSSEIKDFTASIGDTIRITGKVVADDAIQSFLATATVNEVTQKFVEIGRDSLIEEYLFSPIDYVVDFTASGKDIFFDFSLEDFSGSQDSISFTVTIPESPIVEIVADSIGGFGHSRFGNIKNVIDDTLFFPNNVRINEPNQKVTDILFAFQTELGGWTLMSTDYAEASTIWNTQATFKWPYITTNSTRFIKLSEDIDFSQIQTAIQLTNLFTVPGSSSISGLVKGDVIAFRLDPDKAEKIGILQIEDTQGAKASNRYLKANIKVQR